uniref:Uncharacterized protein n=1 Tax=Vitis vinifera TaxID=29760 RepID=A5BW65_VITVI|nr:hypothetical protein VITISV_002005 [Vitis vinifera]
MDYEKVRGGSTEWEGSALKIVAKALKGPLSMILQDGLEVVFPENISLGEDLLFDKEFSKFKEFSRFLGMSVEGCEEEIWSMMRKLRKKADDRGLNNGEKRKLIKSVIRSQKANLVCFLGTKVQEMSLKVVKRLGVGRFLDWGAVDARRASGGILTFWDNSVLDL